METEKRTPVQRLFRLLKPDQREIKNIYVYAIFNGLVNLSLPVGIQAIVNLIQGGQVSTSWIVLVTFVIAGVAATGILQIFQLRITENLQQKIFTRAAFDFAYRIPKVKMEALYRHYAPELMNRFFDIMSVQKGLSKILIDFSGAALQSIFGLILLSLYHPLFIAFSLILVFLIYVIFKYTAKRGLDTSLTESKYKYEVAHWLEEVARTSTTFKLSGDTDLPRTKVDTHVSSYLTARESHFKVLVQQYSLLIVFKVLVATGLLAIGGVLVMEQRINIGQFIASELIILMVITSAEKMILSLETIYDVLTSLEKIAQVTDLPIEESKGLNLSSEVNHLGLEIELHNVDFQYPDLTQRTLNSINLHIKSGEKVMLTGASGSGKSTLLHLLSGLYTINSGNINFDGIPLKQLNLNDLRSKTGDSLSQEQLFEGTIYDNIAMGRDDIEINDVQSAVKHIQLVSFIRSQPEGYQTIIQPGGKRLPKSVIQKLLLARAIVCKPRLLLLENTFDNMEEKDQQIIIKYLTDANQPWTLIAITTNTQLAAHFEKIIIMESGDIKQIGDYNSVKKYLLSNQ